jgi:ubiquitin conjugation factor E4 B
MDEHHLQITEIEDDRRHFISEIFFLNSYARWIGLGPAMQSYSLLKAEIAEMHRTENAADAVLSMTMVEGLRTQLQEARMLEVAMNSVLRNSLDQKGALNFLRFVTNWLLRLVDKRHEHPAETVVLPLQEDIPFEWQSLPQFLIEIVTDYFIHMMKYSPARSNTLTWRYAPDMIIDLGSGSELFILALTFIGPSGSPYIQNSHLKAKLAEVLYWGTLKHSHLKDSFFGKTLIEDQFSRDWATPSIISFYTGWI